MTDEKAFQLYFAIRLHFTTKYDVFVHGTNFKNKSEVSERNDFWLIKSFLKIANSERKLIELCVANHLYGNPEFLYKQDYAEDNYKHWNKVKESIDYTLFRDLSYIELQMLRNKISLDQYLSTKVISDILSAKVEYESIILLDRSIECIQKIAGFDATKYQVRMYKSSKFVNKGTLSVSQLSHIDNFLNNINFKDN